MKIFHFFIILFIISAIVGIGLLFYFNSKIVVVHQKAWQKHGSTGKQKLKKVLKNNVYSSLSESLVETMDPREEYRVSDRVTIRIKAIMKNGSVMTFGGDYFRIKLFSKKPYSAVGPDSFIDYDNGTYLATFTLRWQGAVNVNIQLVHASRVLDLLTRISQKYITESLLFTGIFEKKRQNGTNYTENVHCGLVPRQISYCNVSANHTHGPWFCNKPKNLNISCDDWTNSSFEVAFSSKLLRNLLTQTEYTALTRSKVPLTAVHLPSFKVEALTSTSSSITSTPPACTLQPVPSAIRIQGFFHNDMWQPFDCQLSDFKSDNITSCLNGKSIYFLGDSTARQMYEYIRLQTNCTAQGNLWVQFCRGENMTIHFKFHGPPVRVSKSATVKEISYLSDEIDTLEGGPEVHLVISVWAHFGMPDKSFYKTRLLSIKRAVERLLQRSPETRVLVRSTNTREHSIAAFLLVSSDWVALQEEKILRDVFSNDKRISFLDVWDMTLVQESPDNVHPLTPTLVQIMNYLFTIICQ